LVGYSDYYGFELNGNGRFLLGDFTVTHNTTLAHAILKEYNYQVKEYNASDVRSKKLVNSNLYKIINIGYVDKLWNNNYKEFGIIMDEVDGMSSGDKGGMAELIQFINPNRGKRSVKKEAKLSAENRWIPPIICICNNNYDKKIMDLKKDCLEVIFKAPKKSDLVHVIDRIEKSEQIHIDQAVKNEIAEHAQGDFRRLIFLLQHLYTGLSSKDQIIDSDYLNANYQSFCKKEIDLNSYDTVNKLLNKYQNPVEALKIYETDKSKLPMMIHENYIDFISLQDSDIYTKLDTINETIDSIINGDIIDKAMYNNQSWYLQPIHGLYSCYLPGYYINNRKKTHYKRSDKTTALTNYSFNCANKKNINQIISLINKKSSYDTADIQLLSIIILYELFDPDGNKEKGIECLKYYNLTISELEKLIKMNRLNNPYKNKFTSKSKTFLKKLYGDEKTVQKNVKTYNKSEKLETTYDMDNGSDDLDDSEPTKIKNKKK
jgi:DNA polymerase III delta prime subunit